MSISLKNVRKLKIINIKFLELIGRRVGSRLEPRFILTSKIIHISKFWVINYKLFQFLWKFKKQNSRLEKDPREGLPATKSWRRCSGDTHKSPKIPNKIYINIFPNFIWKHFFDSLNKFGKNEKIITVVEFFVVGREMPGPLSAFRHGHEFQVQWFQF